MLSWELTTSLDEVVPVKAFIYSKEYSEVERKRFMLVDNFN